MKCEIYNDNFQNYKRYGIPKAQLEYNSGEANERKNAIEHKAAEVALKGEKQ